VVEPISREPKQERYTSTATETPDWT
jgi:hypothetical protein